MYNVSTKDRKHRNIDNHFIIGMKKYINLLENI